MAIENKAKISYHKAENKTKKSFLKCAINKKQYFIAFIAYLLITLVLFYQIFANIFTHAPGSGSQTYLNLWTLWWVNHAIFNLHASIYHTNLLFAPIGANLIFQNLSPLSAILVMPFQLLGNVFAYNILLLLGFALSGLGMFALGLYILKNYYAAFIAGLIFSFSSFHIAQAYNNLGFLMIAWVPIALLFFLKILNNEKYLFRNSILLSLSFVLASFMGNIKQGFMLILLFLIIIIIYLIRKSSRKLILRKNLIMYFALSALVAFVLGSFGFFPFLTHINQIMSFNNNVADNISIQQFSINAFSFFIPSYYNSFSKFFNADLINYIFSPQAWQRIAYISYTALVLSIYGLYKNRQSIMFAVIAIIFGILALGPFIQLGVNTVYSNVYSLAYIHIPFVSLIVQPSDFILIFSLMIALLAGYGMKSLEHLKNKKIKNINLFYILFVLVIVIFLIENIGIPFKNQETLITNTNTMQFFSSLSRTNENYSILYLPSFADYNLNGTSNQFYYQILSTYYTSLSNKPLIGGYIADENATQQMLLLDIPLAIQSYSLQYANKFNYVSPINENYSNQTILLLYNLKTQFIVINRNAYNQSQLVNLGGYLVNVFGKPYYISNSSIVFSTKNAFKNIYKTYVGYPQFNSWNLIYNEINGTSIGLWTPNETISGLKAGIITEYAPYNNQSNINPGTVNTTITFDDVSNSKSQLVIAKFNAINKLQAIAKFNITNRLQGFSTSTILNSGPEGNLIAFLELNNNTEISNITFSKN